ncbi:deubiquitinating enzyme [Scheffersomyces spartinae]|uniref:Ubiquitin carboxyl-terminal hydrolase n=1 Tax=Scheffersomyces spartinae TaxID=45513 RepID=A0A9P8AIU8_9ASCO|nr:deubiquitinating enzyme [Scheffersomyces spartinae]KAG7194773.1 deubiquitinating enzyme [Scheffersomyces spartinae]
MSLTITIKYGGKTHEIALSESSKGLDLKQSIQDLTQVPIARQKILVKGGKLADETPVVELQRLKQPFLVLGTPDKNLPTKPIEKQVFLEDMSMHQLNPISNDPSGLVNLGNTCYLNSTLQALYKIKDLTKKVETYTPSQGARGGELVMALKSLFLSMDKKQEKVTPTFFLALFRSILPQFAENVNGRYLQQDAEEAFTQLINNLDNSLNIKDLFRIEMKEVSTCVALPEEEAQINFEESLKLNCHIDIKTNFLRDGILNGLSDIITKHNDLLNSDTDYQLKRTITRLPKYLTVQFVRFFWRTDTRKKLKILRRVQFPFELDLSEMLDESIRSEKVEVRDKLRKIEKDNIEVIREFKKAKKDISLTPLQQQEEDEMKIESIKTKFRDEFKQVVPSGFDFESTTENPSSVYELQAVIAHAGTSADSGHYQAFVRDDNDLEGERWWKFNDDKVSSINKERIESLAGGGESDSALILIYKGVGL